MNHLRAWREFRSLTQEELAEKVGTAGNVIGLLESGERGLSQKWLMKLAPALGTRPGFLLDFDPNDVNRELIEAATELPKETRAQALQILRTFKTGTHG
jgi:transcriptional regulator with XRE-family HTH domain